MFPQEVSKYERTQDEPANIEQKPEVDQDVANEDKFGAQRRLDGINTCVL